MPRAPRPPAPWTEAMTAGLKKMRWRETVKVPVWRRDAPLIERIDRALEYLAERAAATRRGEGW